MSKDTEKNTQAVDIKKLSALLKEAQERAQDRKETRASGSVQPNPSFKLDVVVDFIKDFAAARSEEYIMQKTIEEKKYNVPCKRAENLPVSTLNTLLSMIKERQIDTEGKSLSAELVRANAALDAHGLKLRIADKEHEFLHVYTDVGEPVPQETQKSA